MGKIRNSGTNIPVMNKGHPWIYENRTYEQRFGYRKALGRISHLENQAQNNKPSAYHPYAPPSYSTCDDRLSKLSSPGLGSSTYRPRHRLENILYNDALPLGQNYMKLTESSAPNCDQVHWIKKRTPDHDNFSFRHENESQRIEKITPKHGDFSRKRNISHTKENDYGIPWRDGSLLGCNYMNIQKENTNPDHEGSIGKNYITMKFENEIHDHNDFTRTRNHMNMRNNHSLQHSIWNSTEKCHEKHDSNHDHSQGKIYYESRISNKNQNRESGHHYSNHTNHGNENSPHTFTEKFYAKLDDSNHHSSYRKDCNETRSSDKYQRHDSGHHYSYHHHPAKDSSPCTPSHKIYDKEYSHYWDGPSGSSRDHDGYNSYNDDSYNRHDNKKFQTDIDCNNFDFSQTGANIETVMKGFSDYLEYASWEPSSLRSHQNKAEKLVNRNLRTDPLRRYPTPKLTRNREDQDGKSTFDSQVLKSAVNELKTIKKIPADKAPELRYTIAELRELHKKAKEFRQFDTQGYVCNYLYRDKSIHYYKDIMDNKDGIMEKYCKDFHGDPKSPINGRLHGLFFNVVPDPDTGDPPETSLFGERRLMIPVFQVIAKTPKLYFSDFYCTLRCHYVTLVMTCEGSEADEFCKKNLLEIDPEDNHFFKISRRFIDNVEEVVVRFRPIVEVFFTENVDIISQLECGSWFRDVKMIGERAGGTVGISKNRNCRKCNIGYMGEKLKED